MSGLGKKLLFFLMNILQKKPKAESTISTIDSSTESSPPEKTMETKRITTPAEAEERYGKIENGKWADEGKWMVVYKPPVWFQSQVINSATGKPCTKIYMNKDMVPAFEKAIESVFTRNLIQELKTFDGCFMIRDVRAIPGAKSTHSYGLALDINATENPLGKPPTMSSELVACFTEAGFTWGGHFKRKDGMHFSYAWE
jgi:hypothetical protein